MASLDGAVAVRALHVLAMAAMLGGALLLAWLAWRAPPALLPAARAYEVVFWGAVGVAVVAGVGNLGAMGPTVPPKGSPWAGLLALKLGMVALLLLGSMVRTLAVGLAAAGRAAPPARLGGAYAATALALAVVAAAGVTLAHG